MIVLIKNYMISVHQQSISGSDNRTADDYDEYDGYDKIRYFKFNNLRSHHNHHFITLISGSDN
jgi:hypothetical protein